MDTPGIRGLPPIHGLRGVKPENERRNRRNGDDAFAEVWEGELAAEGSDEEAGAADGDDGPVRGGRSGSLQRGGSVIRRDPTDGEFHVDVLV